MLLAGLSKLMKLAAIIGTGSELELAVEAAKQLSDEGYHIRVVSMPSTSPFDRQDAAYRESVLPAQCLIALRLKRLMLIFGINMLVLMAALLA